VTNIVTLALLIYISLQAVVPGISRRTAVRWALLLLLPAVVLDPVFVNIGLGQINLVLCLMITWDLLGSRKVAGRTVPIGIATGIAAAIKLTPLVFVPYLLLTRRARGAANALVTFALCEAVAFAASPRASWTYWTRDVFDTKRAGALLYVSDQNLSSALQRFSHGPVPGVVLIPLLLAIGAGGLALAAWAHRRSSPMLGLLVCAATGLLISPITWVHHMVWVVPGIIWIAAAKDRPRRGPVLACFVSVLFIAAPIWWVRTSWVPSANPPELHERGWQLIAGNSFFLATVAFLVGITAMLIARRRSSGGHLEELHGGSPVAGGRPRPEAPLEERVPELGVPVSGRAPQVDLRPRDREVVSALSAFGKLYEMRR
jgi:alpha-1,2-mannosyltransferase